MRVTCRQILPSPSETVFLLLVVLVLAGGRTALFNDPGTFWHLRLGREIIASTTVPRVDTLTWTRFGEPWVDQSWGFDVVLALTVEHFGWPTVIALCTLLIAAIYATMARDLIRTGTAPVVAVVVSLLMAAIGCIHFLIRPHLLTFVFVFATLRVCYQQHERGGWSVAWAVFFTFVLANLHGGFLALPVIVACSAAGHALSGPWDQARRDNLRKFAIVFLACLVVPLLNPYGAGLYRHVGHLLVSSGVTDLIDEYQPAPFGKPEARVLEMALLLLIALPTLGIRVVDRYQLCHVLVWLHLSLTSIRHAPLFAFTAAPALASLMSGVPLSDSRGWTEFGRRRHWIWAASIILLVAAMGGVPGMALDDRKWPVSALPALNQQPPASRSFHEQDWGGLIAAECRPTRLSYIDDRFELFGKSTIQEYIAALAGGPAWDLIQDRESIELVWIRPERALAFRLRHDPAWTVVHSDQASILFRRTLGVSAPSMTAAQGSEPRFSNR
jgi:hypothetical protein